MRIARSSAPAGLAAYGASLAKAGRTFTFVARGAHLAAMRRTASRSRAIAARFWSGPAQATDDIAGIGAVDYVLLCVKLWDVESAGEADPPDRRTGDRGGAAAEWRRLGGAAGADPRAWAGDGRHRLRHRLDRRPGRGAADRHVSADDFGELDGRASPRGERLRDLCAAADFEGILSPDVRVPIWEKFLRAGAARQCQCADRVPLGRYRADPDLWALVEASIEETAAVGPRRGRRPQARCVEKGLAMIRSMPTTT